MPTTEDDPAYDFVAVWLRAGDTFVIGIFAFLLLCYLFIRLIFSRLSAQVSQVSLGLGFFPSLVKSNFILCYQLLMNKQWIDTYSPVCLLPLTPFALLSLSFLILPPFFSVFYCCAASHGVRKGGETDLQAGLIGFSSPFFWLVVFVDFTDFIYLQT